LGRVISTALQFIDGFTNPSKEAIKSMRKMGNEAINAGKQMQSAGKTISNVGSNLTKSITLPIVGVAAAAVKMSNDFENSMAKVGTIADTTAVPMETLKKQVVSLSNTVGVGVSDIAEAQYQAISAGVKTANSVEFVNTAIKAAKGGFTDATTAVDGLTTVLNAYGLEASKATDISDQMLVAQNYGKTSFGDMASSMGKVIPIASSLNVSTQELFSSIAVLTKNGIGTSEAVTGLKAAYSNILKPTADASKAAKSLGLDFSAAHLSSVGWAQFLAEIKEKTGGNAETMASLFGSTEALNSVMVLAGKGSKDFTEALGLMGDATGATQAAYEKMLTPAERMNISITKVKNSLIQFGAALTPVFNKFADIIGAIGDRLNNLSEGQVNAIVKFAAVAAAVGPAMLIFGKTVMLIGGVTREFGSMFKTIANFKGIVGTITSPAGIVIGVLAAIAIAAFLIIKNWDKVKVFLDKVGGWFKAAFEKSGFTVERFKEKFSTVATTLSSIFGKISGYIKSFAGLFNSKIRNEIVERMPQIKAAFEGTVKGALIVFDALLSVVESGAKKFNNFLTIVEKAFKNNVIKDWCEENRTALEIAGVAVGTITALVIAYNASAIASAAASGAQTAAIYAMYAADNIAAIGIGAKSAATTIWTTVAGIATTATSGLAAAVTFLTSPIALIIIGIGAAIAVGVLLYRNWDKIKAKAIELGNKIQGSFKAVLSFMKNWGKSVSDAVKNAIGNMVAGTLSKLNQFKTVFTSAFNKAVEAFPPLRIAFEMAKGYIASSIDTIKGVIEGLKTVFNGITTFISGVFTGNWSKAWEGIKTIFKGIFDSFAALAKAPINAVIGIINGAISGINKLDIKIPDWVPMIGGKGFDLNIPTIPMLYKGTSNWQGGTAVIHDRGGEIVDLPKGSRVYPHDKSVAMARKEGAATAAGAITITIQKLADKIEVRSDEDIDRIAEALALKLKKVALNTGTV
jgi:TP901 family phage tail tape measure protein